MSVIGTKAHNDHNVYILGAGFSAEAGLPVIRNFLNVMRDSLDWLQNQTGRQDEIDAVTGVLDFRLRAASAAYRVKLDVENIEELFSLAAAEASSHEPDLFEKVVLAIAAALDYASRTSPRSVCRVSSTTALAPITPLPDWKPIENTHPVPYECPLHDYYLSLVGSRPGIRNRTPSQRDTLITFNYDLVAEDALYRLGIPFSYGLGADEAEFHGSARCVHEYGSDETVRVLKVHGSVNWTSNAKSGRPQVFGAYQDLRADNLIPLLIPPTWRKGSGPQLAPVWDAAVKEIRDATRLIIIGYSIPETDLHFKYMLAAGLQDNISLRSVIFANPQADALKSRFFEIIRPEHESRGVVTFLAVRASELFLGGYRDHMSRAPYPTVQAIGPF